MKRPSRKKTGRWKKILLAVLALAVIAALQEFYRASEKKHLVEQSRFVDVGDKKIRLVCTGRGNMTYILEAGATGFAETWTWVQGELDDNARVCSYDRAGMGLSLLGNQDGFPEETANELKLALEMNKVPGPYVLVGHSMGGFLIRDFAARFPNLTLALVFVDSSHEDQLLGFSSEMQEKFYAFPKFLSLLSRFSVTGLLHIWNPLESGIVGLEGDARIAAKFLAGDREHLERSAEELSAWSRLVSRIRQLTVSAHIPVLSITAGKAVSEDEDYSSVIKPLHRMLAVQSFNGEHVVLERANHFSIIMDKEHAKDLAILIKNFIKGSVLPAVDR